MNYYYKPMPVSEVKNEKNIENVEKAMMSHSTFIEEKTKMITSYTSAIKEYRSGNMKEGEAKVHEGEQAVKRAIEILKKEKENKCTEYMARYDEEYKKGNVIEARECQIQMEKVSSYCERQKQNLVDEHKKIQEEVRNLERSRQR